MSWGRIALALAVMSTSWTAEMQIRDIRFAADWLLQDLEPDYKPQHGRLVDQQAPSDLGVFDESDTAVGIGFSSTNGLLGQHGGLLWRAAFDAKYFGRTVTGQDVGKAGSTTNPHSYYLLVGGRAHLGWGYAFNEYLHVEALPFVGAGFSMVSFPLWSEVVDGTDVVRYWTQPTGDGWYWEAGLRAELCYLLPNTMELTAFAEWSRSRSYNRVNGWIYRDTTLPGGQNGQGQFVTDTADVDLTASGFILGLSFGKRF